MSYAISEVGQPWLGTAHERESLRSIDHIPTHMLTNNGSSSRFGRLHCVELQLE
jgi:hypothetical protein